MQKSAQNLTLKSEDASFLMALHQAVLQGTIKPFQYVHFTFGFKNILNFTYLPINFHDGGPATLSQWSRGGYNYFFLFLGFNGIRG